MNRRAFLRHLAVLTGFHLLGFPPFVRAMGYAAGTSAPRVALIIDDMGYSRARLERFLALELPMTFAILPCLSHSAHCARRAAANGHEVLLHQPMEPIQSRFDPGPGALFVGDGPERIRRILEANLDDLPEAVGVNNHMGSRFTSRQPEIHRALEVIGERGLFFVDSLTSCRSQAFQTACSLRIPSTRRSVFLDNTPQVPAIMDQLHRLTVLARQNGTAIGIGHPHLETAEAIARFAPSWRAKGVVLVPSSRMVCQQEGPVRPSPNDRF